MKARTKIRVFWITLIAVYIIGEQLMFNVGQGTWVGTVGAILSGIALGTLAAKLSYIEIKQRGL